MHNDSDLSVLVLAAGRGKRFDATGGRFKLLERLPDGRTVIKAVCDACVDAGFEPAVVCGAHRGAIEAALRGLDAHFLTCANADAGMGATLKHGLLHARPALGWIVMLGDMPALRPSTIQAVAAALRGGASLARPCVDGRPGHPVGIARRMEGEFLALPDDEGGARIFRARADDVLRIRSNDEGCVYDIDHPGDIPRFPALRP